MAFDIKKNKGRKNSLQLYVFTDNKNHAYSAKIISSTGKK